MTKKTLIILLILIIAIASVGLLFLKPGFSDIKTLKIRNAQKNDELIRKQMILAKIQSLKEKYEQAEEKIQKIYQVLPLKPDIPGIIVQLETLASENGILLEGISYSIPTKPSKTFRPQAKDEAKEKEVVVLQKVTFGLQLSGGYQAFKNFLAELESNLRLMDITDISLSSSWQKAEVTGTYAYNLSLTLYYQE